MAPLFRLVKRPNTEPESNHHYPRVRCTSVGLIVELLAADACLSSFPRVSRFMGSCFAPRTLLEAANLRESHYRSYFKTNNSTVIIDVTDMNRHVSGDYHAVLGDIIVRGGHERSDALMLHFTAPGDDPNYGRAAHYEVRWSEQAFPATAAAFEGLSAQRLYTSPLAAGEAEALELDGLLGGTRYYVGLVAVDRHGNRSPLSNLTTAVTPAGIPRWSATSAPSARRMTGVQP